MLADKAYDSNAVRNLIAHQGGVLNIPLKATRRGKLLLQDALQRP